MGKSWKYGIVFDAGSSGTRLHVYRWESAGYAHSHASEIERNSLPRLTLKKIEKIRPGVSNFATNPSDIGPDHLQSLVDVALDEVPAKNVPDTPIFFMATAGMRLLPDEKQQSLLNETCKFLKLKTPFFVGDCQFHVRVISGETEGLYGWVAANYLLGGFDSPELHDHGKGHHTIGFLDMGGASAQIAFAPNSTEAEKHANDLKLVRMRRLDGSASEYRVFTATWLGFGANRARERYVELLRGGHASTAAGSDIFDPCLPRGLRTLLDGGAAVDTTPPPGVVSLTGTGDFQQCLQMINPLLGKEVPCEDDPCLFDGKHVPAIDFDVNHFIGVSEFWHTTNGMFGKSKGYDLDTYQRKVTEFCGREWSEIEASFLPRKKTSEQKMKNAQDACFKAAWLISVLYDGIGIPRVVGLEGSSLSWNVSRPALEIAKESGFLEPFKPVNKIDGVDLSWTLGKMVLYASGEIPPADPGLPVGYGSSDGRLAGFEYAGSSWELFQDDVFLGVTSFLPTAGGLVLVSLVILVAGFICRNRERRARFSALFGNYLGRHKRQHGGRRHRQGIPLVRRIFRRGSGVAYEQILEEGAPEQFELDGAESDDVESEGSESARSSHVSGPKRPVEWRDDPTSGAAMSVVDRRGLAVRTASRERLSPNLQMSTAGRKIRGGSPTRLKSPLLPTQGTSG